MQSDNFQAAPLELPELQDLEPLLLNLPDTTADALGGEQTAGAPSRLQRYPELHFLRAMLQLQQALQQVQSCQQPVPAGSKGVVAQGDVSQQQVAALQSAYAAARQPVQDLLLNPGLTPAALRLPLLLYIAPLLESAYMPFSRTDVAGLQRIMAAVTAGLPSVAAAVIEGSHGSLAGVTWPVELTGNKGAAAVNAARLALCRGLARAHVAGSRVQAW